MKSSHVKLSNPVQELFFVIAPPRHIKSDVSVLKDDVQYLIGHEFADRYSAAHISLFRFDNAEHFEDIIAHVTSKAARFRPFNIFIKNMVAFHQGSVRTICLDIVNKYHVREIFERTVREDAQYTPNITIARSLDAEDFSKVWPYLKDFEYSQHFLCDRIAVLAKSGNRWVHYQEIPFGQ